MAAHTKIDLYQMQSLPLDAKIRMTARRIDAFIDRNDAYIRATCFWMEKRSIHHVREYKIESSAYVGKAELTIKMLAQFPVSQGGIK
mgnify:CR=1 FL=1